MLGSRLRLLGPVHLDTAVSRHRLASVLHDLGRLDEAITEYRAAQPCTRSPRAEQPLRPGRGV